MYTFVAFHQYIANDLQYTKQNTELDHDENGR